MPLYEYRDGGAAGDAFVQGLVRSLRAVLEPGGIAQLLGNWEIGRRRRPGASGWHSGWTAPGWTRG